MWFIESIGHYLSWRFSTGKKTQLKTVLIHFMFTVKNLIVLTTKISNFQSFSKYSGPTSHRPRCDGCWLPCFMVAPQQIVSWHGHRNIRYIYISQFIFIFHDYNFDLWPHVAVVRGFWHERYRFAGECIVQHLFAVFHLRRSTLCLAACTNEFPKEIADGRIELDEFGCPNGNQYVLTSHGNESIQHQLRWIFRR